MKNLLALTIKHITPPEKNPLFLAIMAAIMALLLPACSLTPDYQAPTIETPPWRALPQTEGRALDNAALDNTENGIANDIRPEWWTDFGSDELNQLIKRALANNQDLQAALHRIEQARETRTIVNASRLPTAGIGTGLRTGTTQATNITDQRKNGIPDFTVDAGIAYEVDLFGRNRANTESASSALLGSQYAHDALALIVMSDVANTYFEVLNRQSQLRIAKQKQQIATQLLQVIQARFQTGSRTQLDISQQEQNVAESNATVTALEQALETTQNALAVLVGEPAQTFRLQAQDFSELNVPKIAALQPAELLERRPDIKSIEARLQAANADIGAARAAFYPSLNIGANLLLAINPSATALPIAGSLFAPIFQGGRLQANLNRVTAKQKELVANYRQTVLVAFKEAENALTTAQKTTTRQTQLQQASDNAYQTYQIAKKQHDLGVADLQTVLTSQQAWLTASDTLERASLARLAASVALFKAMGGGWQE